MTRWGSPLNLMTWPLRISLAAGMNVVVSSRRVLRVEKGSKLAKAARGCQGLRLKVGSGGGGLICAAAIAWLPRRRVRDNAPYHIRACARRRRFPTLRVLVNETTHPCPRRVHQGQRPPYG